MRLEFIHKQKAQDLNQTMNVTLKMIPEALIIKQGEVVIL